MANDLDEAKGRAKRAIGELTDNNRLKREGTIDKGAGKAKESIDKTKGLNGERLSEHATPRSPAA